MGVKGQAFRVSLRLPMVIDEEMTTERKGREVIFSIQIRCGRFLVEGSHMGR